MAVLKNGDYSMEVNITPPLEEAKKHINSINFSNIISKMVNHQGWRISDATKVCHMYRNFLYLNKKYGMEKQLPLPPSEEIDEFWHNHILDTKQYRKDCQAIFGKYLDHYPYLGIDGKSSSGDVTDAFAELQRLYAKEFGGAQIYQVRGFTSKLVSFIKNHFKNKFPRYTITT